MSKNSIDYDNDGEEIEVSTLFIVAFNSNINIETTPPTAEVGIEYFAEIGTEADYFTYQISPEDFEWPSGHPGEHKSRLELIIRFNPHRHIRAYTITTTVDPVTFREWVTECPEEAEKLIKEKGQLYIK